MEIGIGIVTFNRYPIIRKCIESILRHVDYPYNLTIVDDGSFDETRDYLKKLKEKGIIKNLILLDKNVGIAEARNILINNISEQYIFMLDGDEDFSQPFLKKLVTVLNKEPKVGMVSVNYKNLNTSKHWKGTEKKIGKNITLVISRICCAHAYLIRRKIFDKIGKFVKKNNGRIGFITSSFMDRVRESGWNIGHIKEVIIGYNPAIETTRDIDLLYILWRQSTKNGRNTMGFKEWLLKRALTKKEYALFMKSPSINKFSKIRLRYEEWDKVDNKLAHLVVDAIHFKKTCMEVIRKYKIK